MSEQTTITPITRTQETTVPKKTEKAWMEADDAHGTLATSTQRKGKKWKRHESDGKMTKKSIRQKYGTMCLASPEQRTSARTVMQAQGERPFGAIPHPEHAPRGACAYLRPNPLKGTRVADGSQK
jgi:hypothetical protein